MQFSSLKTTIVSGLALCSVPAFSALTATQIKNGIDLLATKSLTLQVPANNIDLLNTVLNALNLGPIPQVFFGLLDIASTAGTAFAQIPGSPPVAAGVDATAIHDSFRDFVEKHRTLLNILIQKATVVSDIPLIAGSVGIGLRFVEIAVVTITDALVKTVPSREKDIQKLGDSLRESIDTAAKKYEGGSSAIKMIKRGHGVKVEAAA